MPQETPNFQEAFSKRYQGITDMVKGPDFIEGPMAFAQKRKPNWSGE
jgi:enoyl-CoA hydratase/carnithine racemase